VVGPVDNDKLRTVDTVMEHLRVVERHRRDLDRARCRLDQRGADQCNISNVWRSMTAMTGASLLGKYR